MSPSQQETRKGTEPWEQWTVSERLACIRRFRDLLARDGLAAARAALPQGTMTCDESLAEALSSQVVPLAEAARFLERSAESILKPRKLSRWGQPIWLAGVRTEIRREPIGRILILAPGNYPLFLPGVQVLQALVAGNAVLWKPAPGGEAAAAFMSRLLGLAGVPAGMVQILGVDLGEFARVLGDGVAKVVLTGSARTGAAVMEKLAPRLIPAVMELSGCDVCYVRHDADLTLAARAIAFGLRLNRGQTCIAPRRIFVHQQVAEAFRAVLATELDQLPNFPVPVGISTENVMENAQLIYGDSTENGWLLPLVVAPQSHDHFLVKTDLFTQIATWWTVGSDEEMLAGNAFCPFALGASVFSRDVGAAWELAGRLGVGIVVVNDVIVPTADGRVPFGGRGMSGYGVTRGAEGLLEMTVVKVIQGRRGRGRHLEGGGGVEFFRRYLESAHKRSLAARLTSVYHLTKELLRMAAGRNDRETNNQRRK
jgi:acyl-CoA reductase-like NAD-dependent aldehyde dehydrogenase